MDIRHIRYFVAVAEELHFGRAAQRLQMSQSPLSARIRELEREVGGELLHRTTREVALTPLGEVFLDRAYRVLEAVTDLEHAVAQQLADQPADGVVRVGILPHLSTGTATAYHQEAAEAGIRVEFHSLSSVEQIHWLLHAKLDLGFVLYAGPWQHSGTHLVCTLQKPLGLVVSSDHRLAGRTSVQMKDLAGESLIMFSRDRAPDVHDHLLAVIKAAGFLPERIYYMAQLHPSVVSVAQGVLFHESDVTAAEGLVWIPVEDVDLCWRAAIVARRAPSARTLLAAELLQRTLRRAGWVAEAGRNDLDCTR